ncbi:MAG: glycoside hydrolase family 5 protein [Halanaerobiales bacterium]
MGFLEIRGNRIVDEKGEEIFLRGVNFGGWLNMENFISGYIGAESSLKEAIRKELGEERYQAFFESFLDAFISEGDFEFLSDIGANVVRLPFNYRLFEDDMYPGEYLERGFEYIDRAVEWARKYNIYIILDFHALPGWQNRGWHSDNPHHISLLWDNRDFQERVKGIWEFIAGRYSEEKIIAGYDLMNEPEAPSIEILNDFYCELVQTIRTVDKNHIIFLEGNNYASEFEGFNISYDDNLALSSHNYTTVTHSGRRYPGPVVKNSSYPSGKVYADKEWLENKFKETNSWMLEIDKPCLVGEFGALFDGEVNNPLPADLERLKALKDQLEIFNKYEQHWTIWTYKDVGVQGLVVSDSDSEYRKRIRPVNKMKQELGLDGWTARGKGALHSRADDILSIVAENVIKNLNDYSLDYKGYLRKKLGQRAICGTVANILSMVYAAQFVDLSSREIRKMHERAFKFENCRKREYLIAALREGFSGN